MGLNPKGVHMGIHFTPQQLKGLKATDKRQEIRDTGADNLYVVVQPHTGRKSFVMRISVDGKQRKKTLGYFPALSLADARDKASEVKIALRRGEPPPIQIGPARPVSDAPRGMTVAEAWDLYWQHEASQRKSAAEKKRIFEKEVKPQLGIKLLNEVTRDDLSNIISSKFQSAKTSSNRLHSLLARFFKWCFTHGQALTKLESNPMSTVLKMHSERNTARRRYLSEQELGWWFQSLEAAGDYAAVHELLMRTLCRFSDILDLTWGEVVERDNGDLVLEFADAKNDQPHVVYLHSSALKLLPKRPAEAKHSDKVFGLNSRSGKPVDKVRAKMEELARKQGLSVPHWQPHDYRRTGTTHLAGMTDDEDNPLVVDHILDRLLSHKEQRVIRHYNRYGYYKEKKNALKVWNNWLDAIPSKGHAQVSD